MSESFDEATVLRQLRTTDGYRTPTIEDAERAISVPEDINLYPSARIRQVHTSALGFLSASPVNLRSPSVSQQSRFCKENGQDHEDGGLASQSLGNSTWKQRIRHVTWAFFTLTMATGGIANALYDGTN